jgi:ABC-type ATPase involved in cell division
MAAQITTDAAVVDIEIELPDGSVVWLEPETGLNVIYGKNGSGKTSFLRAITSGMRAGVIYLHSPKQPPGGILQTSNDVHDVIKMAISDLRHNPKFVTNVRFHEELFQPPTPSELWSQIDVRTKRLRRHTTSGRPRFSQYRLSDEGKQLLIAQISATPQNTSWLKFLFDPSSDIPDDEWWIEYREAYETCVKAAMTEINEIGVVPHQVIHPDPVPLVQSIRSAIEHNIDSDIREMAFGLEGEKADEFRQQFARQVLSTDEKMARLMTWNLIDLLVDVDWRIAWLGMERQHRHLFGPESRDWFTNVIEKHSEQGGDLIRGDLEEPIHTFEVALTALLDGELMAVVRDPNLEQVSDLNTHFQRGIPHYAIRLPHSVPQSPISETDKFFSYILTFLEEFAANSGKLSAFGLIGAIYLQALGERPRVRTAGQKQRYLRIRPRSKNVLSDAPGIVDLDTPVDLNAIALSLMDISTDQGTWMLSPPSYEAPIGDVSADLPNQSSAQSMIDYASSILRSLDIGLSEIVLNVGSDYHSVRLRSQPEITFRTAGDRRPIAFTELSSAQQRWTTLLLNLLLNEPSRNHSTIFVADEPDSGVHQSASRQILDFLAGLPCTSLITSHSPTSLRIDDAHLVHLSVASNGQRTVSPPALSKVVGDVAADLGVSPIDLLALRKLLIVCEGHHDAAVIEELIGCSTMPGLQQRVIVAAVNGVANLHSTATCSIITDYTELKVLHVADNSNLEEINKIVDSLRTYPLNMSFPKALALSGLAKRRDIASPEDRVMLNLLEAIASRGLLDRFHLYGFAKKDIIEYLPEESFGLKDSWTQLRSDFHGFVGKKLDFKEWLRKERAAQISTRRIREAFSQFDDFHMELRALLKHIESLAVTNA